MYQFQAPSPEKLNPLFPNYEIDSLIACGGMGAVYLGCQLSLDREVAIKILPSEFVQDNNYLSLFQSEAKALAKLNHKNLVGIYDYGQLEGLYYIIMEYVPGRSLYDTADGLAVDQEEAALLIIEICKGLAHAHEHGILHRDIKPGNILIDEEARPKLVDFGLAKPIEEGYQGGLIFGTKGYAAPEITKNPNAVDHRADVFAVGAMLHELLVGELPRSPYIKASELTDTDPRFDAIIEKAIHPLMTLRYDSCRTMAKDLESLLARMGDAHNSGQRIFEVATAACAEAPRVAGFVVAPVVQAQPTQATSSSRLITPSVTGTSYYKKKVAPTKYIAPPSSGGGMAWIIVILVLLIFIVVLVIGTSAK